jgi:hypothetical protein
MILVSRLRLMTAGFHVSGSKASHQTDEFSEPLHGEYTLERLMNYVGFCHKIMGKTAKNVP